MTDRWQHERALSADVIMRPCAAGRELYRPDDQEWRTPCNHGISNVLAVGEDSGAVDYLTMCDCHMAGLRTILPAGSLGRIA